MILDGRVMELSVTLLKVIAKDHETVLLKRKATSHGFAGKVLRTPNGKTEDMVASRGASLEISVMSTIRKGAVEPQEDVGIENFIPGFEDMMEIDGTGETRIERDHTGLIPMTGIINGNQQLNYLRLETDTRMDIEDMKGFKIANNVNRLLSKSRFTEQIIASWNARSLKKELMKIRRLLDSNVDIILIQETWLDGHQEMPIISNSLGSCYGCKRMDRDAETDKTGGGTLVLFKSGIEIIKEARINKDSGLYIPVRN